MDVNWLAVIAAAISSFLLGGIWYGPVFGKAWMNAAALDEAALKARNLALVFGGSFVLALIASASFAVFLGPEVDATTGALYGATAGVCWVGASFGINYLFERKSLALFLINGGYHAIQFTLIGLVLGAWR
ncbi:DUF1761 domain-containing protein [Candidatus Viadribacter manganicus]|uniref:DUF1761 domain-containing protein n=1 Tax=Candidatus Viadribacter manganicus TaxID=1759059 RepID=A0A1B1AGH4_9PROT|nr:DUF1761 domain-containing protein [Candidatus Viadribacter manganicus]ANP45653.1 hypothetical protein ATE48_06825 [Candidatus Viadribacter manganicus]